MDKLGKLTPVYKKYLTLVGVLVVFVIFPIVVIFLQKSKFGQPENKEVSKPAKKTVPATALLYASELGTPDSIDITLDAKKNLISGIQLEMKYDPSSLSNVSIEPAAGDHVFFGTEKNYYVLVNKVNAREGRISFWIGIAPTSLARAGIGKVATIYYKKLLNKPTTITFLPETQASELNATNNVLQGIEPIAIK